MELSIIIVSYNSSQDIKNCLNSIRQHCKGFLYEVIIVNNYHPDEQLALVVGEYPGTLVLTPGENKGFGFASNQGLEVAKGRFVCFMNPDIILLSNPLPALHILEENPQIGLLGPLLRNEDNSLQRSCYQLPTVRNWFSYQLLLNTIFPKACRWGNFPRFDFAYANSEKVGWVSGAYMVMPAGLAKEIGGFDDRFFLYCEDLDLCWSVQDTGKEVWFSNCFEAVHLGGSSIGNKTVNSARHMADAYAKLFLKRFSLPDQRKMLRYAYWGSMLRRWGFSILSKLKQTGREDEIAYHRAHSQQISQYRNKKGGW